EGGALTMFGELAPWVTMADALGWSDDVTVEQRRGAGMAERHGDRPKRPAASITAGAHRRLVLDRRQQHDGPPVVDCDTEPAPTLTGIAGSRSQWVFREIQGHGAVRTLDQPAMTIPASADNGNYRF